MLRSIRKYSSSRRVRLGAASPLVSFLVGVALLGGMAIKAWWDRTHAPVRPPLPPITADLPSSVAARVLKVVDGDTFDARIEIKPGVRLTARVRLRGVDAPELHAACTEERIAAETAQQALRAILAEGGVTIRDLGEDRYGRLLGTVTTRTTGNVSEALIAKGVARRYDGGRRRGWC